MSEVSISPFARRSIDFGPSSDLSASDFVGVFQNCACSFSGLAFLSSVSWLASPDFQSLADGVAAWLLRSTVHPASTLRW